MFIFKANKNILTTHDVALPCPVRLCLCALSWLGYIGLQIFSAALNLPLIAYSFYIAAVEIRLQV